MNLSRALAKKAPGPRITQVRKVGKYEMVEARCDLCGEWFYDEDIMPVSGAHDYDLFLCPSCLGEIDKFDVVPPDGCVRCGKPVTSDNEIDQGVFMCYGCERRVYG